MNLDALILKRILIEQDEEPETDKEEKKELSPFEEDPMGFILKKYNTLNELLTELMTESFQDYLNAIFIVAPKPTTFKILLHNGQYFFLTYLEKAYQATISGKNYYLMTTGEKQLCMQAIARLLRYGSPLKTKGPDGAEQGPEASDEGETTEAGEETAAPEAEAGGEEETLAESKILETVIKQYMLLEKTSPEQDILRVLKSNKNIASLEPTEVKKATGSSNYKVYFKNINTKDKKARVDVLSQLSSVNGVKVIKKASALSSTGYAEITTPNGTYNVAIKGSSDTATTTDVKEGLVLSFFYSSISDPITIENFDSVKKQLISATNKSKYIESELKTQLVSFLNTVPKSKNNAKLLNQPLSQALTIKNAYPESQLIRSGLFNEYRSKAHEKLGIPADKWCPGDVYVLINQAEAETILALANEQDNPASFIEILNDAFNEEWGSTESPMTAVSLKFEKAQGGKAKAYFQKYTKIKDEYNLTKDEIGYKEKNFIDGISRLRKELTNNVKNVKDIKYSIVGGNDLKNDLDFLRAKYAALKAINFFFSQLDKSEYDDGLVALVAFAMSLSDTSPAFFKVIASSSGAPTKPEKYDRGGSLSLFIEDGKVQPIEITDSATFGGLEVKMTVSKGGHPYFVNLVARNNGMVQGTIEILKVVPQKK